MSAASFLLVLFGALFQIGGFLLALYQSVATRRRRVPDTPSVYTLAGRRVGRSVRNAWRKTLSTLRRGLSHLGIKRTVRVSVKANVSLGANATARGRCHSRQQATAGAR